MNSKKKLIISLSALAVVALIAVVAVVAVLAAGQQTLTSSIRVQYIAQDVSATVSAKYYICELLSNSIIEEGDFTTSGTAEGSTSITFEPNTDEGIYDLQPTTDTFNIDKDQYIEFVYTFKNNSTTSFIKLTPDFKNEVISNMDVSYNQRRTMTTSDKTASLIIEPEEELTVVISMSVARGTLGDDASYSVNLEWNMTKATESEYRPHLEQLFTNDATILNGELKSYTGNLTKIYIPEDRVTSISATAFAGNDDITYVYIPKSVTSLANGDFLGCVNLKEVEFAEDIQLSTVPSQLFQDCTSLTNIVIPNTVTRIDALAFSNCQSLTNITIPSSVINMVGGNTNGSFKGCTNLTITIEGNDAWEITGDWTSAPENTELSGEEFVVWLKGANISSFSNIEYATRK